MRKIPGARAVFEIGGMEFDEALELERDIRGLGEALEIEQGVGGLGKALET